jgi:hypothetical protein
VDWYRGTHLVLMDAPRTHHGTTTRLLRAPGRQNRRSTGVSVEPEGGLEPPTCRLRGRSRPTTTSKADRVEQLRKADCQAGNDCIKGGTLAETLAEQSRLSRTSCPFRLSDPHAPDRASARGTSAGWCIAVLRMIWVEGKARRRPSSVMASTYAGGAAGAGLRVGVRGR